MAVISDLPPELLLQIYEFLASIDDVYTLARCSKLLYSIIAVDENVCRIMTMIIVSV